MVQFFKKYMVLIGFFVAKGPKIVDTKYPNRVCMRIKSIQFFACDLMGSGGSRMCKVTVRGAHGRNAHILNAFSRSGTAFAL